MHALLSILVSGIEICVAAIGAVRFSCVASAAHFLNYKIIEEESKMRGLKRTISILLSLIIILSVFTIGL